MSNGEEQRHQRRQQRRRRQRRWRYYDLIIFLLPLLKVTVVSLNSSSTCFDDLDRYFNHTSYKGQQNEITQEFNCKKLSDINTTKYSRWQDQICEQNGGSICPFTCNTCPTAMPAPWEKEDGNSDNNEELITLLPSVEMDSTNSSSSCYDDQDISFNFTVYIGQSDENTHEFNCKTLRDIKTPSWQSQVCKDGKGGEICPLTCNTCPEPSSNPSLKPSSHPSTFQSQLPSSSRPSSSPSLRPTIKPSSNPSLKPSFHPSIFQSQLPSPSRPSSSPSLRPTIKPSSNPSFNPSSHPSTFKSQLPSSSRPSSSPSLRPTIKPSFNPSHQPTLSFLPLITANFVDITLRINKSSSEEPLSLLTSSEAKQFFEIQTKNHIESFFNSKNHTESFFNSDGDTKINDVRTKIHYLETNITIIEIISEENELLVIKYRQDLRYRRTNYNTDIVALSDIITIPFVNIILRRNFRNMLLQNFTWLKSVESVDESSTSSPTTSPTFVPTSDQNDKNELFLLIGIGSGVAGIFVFLVFIMCRRGWCPICCHDGCRFFFSGWCHCCGGTGSTILGGGGNIIGTRRNGVARNSNVGIGSPNNRVRPGINIGDRNNNQNNVEKDAVGEYNKLMIKKSLSGKGGKGSNDIRNSSSHGTSGSNSFNKKKKKKKKKKKGKQKHDNNGVGGGEHQPPTMIIQARSNLGNGSPLMSSESMNSDFSSLQRDEESTLTDPPQKFGMVQHPGSITGYGDASVATVDYDYGNAYGGGADDAVSSSGGTFGSTAKLSKNSVTGPGGNSSLESNPRHNYRHNHSNNLPIDTTAAMLLAAAGGGPGTNLGEMDDSSFEGNMRRAIASAATSSRRSSGDDGDGEDDASHIVGSGGAVTVKQEIVEVVAPSGKLGVVIDTPNEGAPVVHALKEGSCVGHMLQVGDKLIAVDDEDVRLMSAIQVSKLISKKSSNRTRVLKVVRSVLVSSSSSQTYRARSRGQERSLNHRMQPLT